MKRRDVVFAVVSALAGAVLLLVARELVWRRLEKYLRPPTDADFAAIGLDDELYPDLGWLS